jgi:putative membrane protein
MWYFHEGMGWWMVFGGIWMVVFWGGLIALVIWGVNRLTHRSDSSRKSPLDLAKERYARGEITREEFEKIKKDLT